MAGTPEYGRFPAIVYGSRKLRPRTTRALHAAGADVLESSSPADGLRSAEGVIAIAKSGIWFPTLRRIPELPPAGEWIAVGAWIGSEDWERALSRCGGDFSRLRWWHRRPSAPPAMLFSPAAARRFGALLGADDDIEKAWRAVLRSGIRIAHLPEFDAHFSERLRVLQLVTSIQIGGAERVALDLAAGLPAHGVDALVVILGKPTRDAFPAPQGLVDLSEFRGNPARVAQAVFGVALRFGADAAHAHLVRAAEARAIRGLGLPLILHIHNFPAGWPPDYTDLAPEDATLLTACAQKVEREVVRLLPAMTARTIWNGISGGKGLAARKNESAFTVMILANPRRQKRLERIPEIARTTARLLAPRPVRFVIAGARDPYSADSAEAILALETAILKHNAAGLIERPGLIADTDALLAGADVMLSVSAFEGLSLAHLEALSAGLPLVATDAGGTCEIAAQSRAVTLLPIDADAAQIAEALIAAPTTLPATLPKSFTRDRMAARTAWLLAAVVRRGMRGQRDGLWLVANNFSTGGAQSSARRLLIALRQRGVKVRAAVIQEQPEFPTPGRRALMEAGVPVFAVESAEALLEVIEADAPEAVFFWNVITSWKIQLADALLDMRIFDISPGEMLFSSLARFFENPPAGLPYREPLDYGARLAGMVVKFSAEAARAAGLGCGVSVIRNGIAIPPLVPRRKNDLLVLGTAARLSPDKKLGDLLAAVRLAAPNLPPFVLRIAGGPERDFPEHAAELRGLATGLPVEWLGEVREIEHFLHALDIFVMISEPAGCPNATLEASAAGLPVVATDHGGAREQVLDGITGRLVPRGDAKAFAQALIELAGALELRERMGEAARAHVGAEFSIGRMVEDYDRVIHGRKTE